MTAPTRLSTTLGMTRSLLVYYAQPWRRRALKRFYRDLVRPGDLAFDIGAHVGSRSRTLLSLGADVVAVEPQPAFADFIERHFAGKLKAFERVAVGADVGEIDLRISSRHPTVTSTSGQFIDRVGATAGFSAVTWDHAITVAMTTLDTLIARHGMPAFCKIDVEGAEAEILKGLSQPLPLIAFEYIPAMPSVAVDAVERLIELGDYRFNRVVGERHRFVTQDWVDGGTLLAELSGLGADSPSGDIYARLDR
ncbi:FkbM family methyltransferase [Rhizobium halophytocola]|uniref:FkbM family methyltransferase n=1 Tax=Rhizobium halophytocola TaxID=735519 RepID=A0ABS4DUV5_9HYPH|nr:FkbM family methyltransferase [Rhizobium halophytocola]MBP1849478.1 FkbM family methyltransferase [Rhizobium halophytocola]